MKALFPLMQSPMACFSSPEQCRIVSLAISLTSSMQRGQLSSSVPGGVIAANKNSSWEIKKNNWNEIYRKTQDKSGRGLLGYSVDAVFWTWLSWVVASQVTGEHWLEPTYTCLRRFSLSPPVILSLLSIPPSTRLLTSSWLMRKSSTRGKRR